MSENKKLQITALEISDVIEVLRLSGSIHINEEKIREDIEAGAPVNADGTINYIKYISWVAKKRQEKSPD